ncbi:Fc.00g007550.m01.CDS01 [Cosmosporella sp. VM-42]
MGALAPSNPASIMAEAREGAPSFASSASSAASTISNAWGDASDEVVQHGRSPNVRSNLRENADDTDREL